jgi:CHAT domain-containing protein
MNRPVSLLLSGVLCIGAVVAAESPGRLSTVLDPQAAYEADDFASAASQWTAVAERYHEQGDPLAESRARARLAEARQAQGQYRQAVSELESALALVEHRSQPGWQAAILDLLGGARIALGERSKARESLDAGLALARQAGDVETEAAILNNIGNLYSDEHHYVDALELYRESLDMAGRVGLPVLTAQAAANSAAASLALQRFEQAKTYAESALESTRRLADSHEKAYLMIRVAQTQRKLAGVNPDQGTELLRAASTALNEAAQIASAASDRRAASWAYGYQGEIYAKAGRTDEALALMQRAIFNAQQINAAELLYRWEWRRGRLLAARGDITEAIPAYRRAVSILQTLRTGMAPKADPAVTALRQDAGALYLEFADLLLRAPETKDEANPDRTLLVEARETVELLKTTELEDYFQDDCIAAVRAKIRDVDETIEPGTAVLYPIVFQDRTEIILSLPSGLQRFVVPVSREVLVSTVNDYRNLLEDRITRRYLKPARQLYDWLIRPLEATLAGHDVHTLVLVPDATLRGVPLAALHDGKAFLIRKYAIATTPSLRLTDPRPIRRRDVQLLLSGLTVPVDGFPPLVYVDSELQAIHALYGGTTLEDEDFRKDRVEEELEKHSYTIVHFATHGQFSGRVRDSFVLTYDGRMNMDELEQFVGISWFRQDRPVELLTLSACETAAGDDTAALGLAGVAIKAGARSALASLWLINDEAGSELVTSFYRNLKDPTVSKARALQLAQLEMLDKRRYRHPGYWSPFLLIGNWL